MKRITFKTGLVIFLALGFALTGFEAFAQSEEEVPDYPPEILTSDLALKTILDSNRIEANFVIVDDDEIVEVTINGEAQTFEPADTVVLSKELVFSKDVTEVVVTAKDAAGHEKTVTYTVYLPGVSPERKVQEDKMTWFVHYNVRYELDDNPSQDLSSPISLEGIELQGVVPDDEQDDNRINLTVIGGIAKGPWSLFAGISRISYSKSDIASRYDVEMNLLGAAYKPGTGGFEAGYLFADINLGDFDYALTHTFTPGYRTLDSGEDGTGQTLWGVDVALKQFASDAQDDTTVFTLVWDRSTLDQAKQDSYRRLIVLGSASEGIEQTEFNFFGLDMDWKNRWDSGWLWDIGWGWQYRDYENEDPLTTETFLGDTRVDNPLRFSTGIGYQFLPQLALVFDYRYVFNFSNKIPYVRQIFGVGVNGTF